MFKGIQDVMHKKPSADDKTLDLSLTRIKKAQEILAEEKPREFLPKFPALLSLSADNYAQLCTPLIERFAEFVQDLPETRGGYFSLRGGILEHALSRASIGLSILRSYFVPGDDDTAPLTQPQTLWAYAIFTAGILQGVGKIAVDLRVDLYDRHQKPLKEWSPFEGTMLGQGTYYKYDFDNPFPDDFRQRACLLLARQLMPEAGFRWIASNKDLFSIWLALLDDDQRGGRNLGAILWRADALAIQQYFEDHNLLRDPSTVMDKKRFGQLLSGFTGLSSDEITNTRSAQMAAAFTHWLQSQIADQAIDLDDGPVVVVPGGVLISDDAFKLFVRENSNFKNWQAVQTAFTGLGIHRIGSSNEIFQNYVKMLDKTTVSGLLVTNKELLMSKEMAETHNGAGYSRAPSAQNTSAQFISTTGQLTSQVSGAQATTQPKIK